MEEWVEVRAKTVEEAVEEGLRALGLESADAAEIEVLREPQRGFLGFGGEAALVRMKARPKPRQRRRSRGGGGDGGEAGRGELRSSPGGERRQGQGRGGSRESNRGGSREVEPRWEP